jgi:hypothetical protein
MSLPPPASADSAVKRRVNGQIALWSMELRFGDQSLTREVLAELEELGFGARVDSRRGGRRRHERRHPPARRHQAHDDRHGDPEHLQA